MKKIAILMYHRIGPDSESSRYVCASKAFERQMLWLRRSGLAVVGLEQIVRSSTGAESVPRGAVAVTFDDGHEDFCRYALPVLESLKIPATMFVVAGKLGGTDDWMPADNPRMPLMAAEQVRELPRRGISVGSHSLTHPRLPELDDIALAHELRESRERLSEVLEHPVDLLAYPYGLHDERVVRMARAAGYAGACSTRSGFNASGVDPMALRRIDVYGTDSLRAFRHKLELGVNDGTIHARAGYLATRLIRKVGAFGGKRALP